MSDLALWIITATAFVFGMFYSGCETAFIAADWIRLRHLAGKGSRRARLVIQYKDDPEYFLSAVLVGTNLAVIGCTTAFTAIAVRRYGDAGSTIATVILVPVILLLNEIIPKGIFLTYANRAALWSLPVLRGLTTVLYPVVKTFSVLADLLTRLFPTKPSSRKLDVTMEELLFHIGDSKDAGVISSETTVLAKRASELKDLKARDVMVPLEKVVMIDIDSPDEEYARVFKYAGYSRLPVYKDGRSSVVGIMSVHELLRDRGRAARKQNLTPPYTIYLDTPIVDVLTQMKEKGRHMAMIRDEKGFVGMATMEDILEKFIGAIADEFN